MELVSDVTMGKSLFMAEAFQHRDIVVLFEVCRSLIADSPEITVSLTAGLTKPMAVSGSGCREIIR